MKKSLITLLIFMMASLSFKAILLASGGGQIESDMLVSAFVPEIAQLEVTNLNFGSYDETNGNTAEFIVTVNASLSTTYAITINAGNHYNAGYVANARSMSDGTNNLSYLLYHPGTKNEWGDLNFGDTYIHGTGLPGTGTGSNQYFTGIGEIPPNQPGIPGNYTDIVMVTINL